MNSKYKNRLDDVVEEESIEESSMQNFALECMRVSQRFP